jgi:hypothetical protein
LPEGLVVAVMGVEFQLHFGELFFIRNIDEPETGIALIDGH